MKVLPDAGFWSGRRVLLTGHTGFKGSWLSAWLTELGAEVLGLSLAELPSSPSLWDELALPLAELRTDITGDGWRESVVRFDPSVVLHLAAQPLVSRGYAEPLVTFDVNVGGTGRLLDALGSAPSVEAVLVITTDKVYDPRQPAPYREEDYLGGKDPYSASKAATEHLVHSWPATWPLATARAGNVIGGGDWASDRLLPDIERAWSTGSTLSLRSSAGVRPWQHVLEPLRGYLLYVEALVSGADRLPSALNFGPSEADAVPVGELVAYAAQVWAAQEFSVGAPSWRELESTPYAETGTLVLASALAVHTLGWTGVLHWREAVDWTLGWNHSRRSGTPARTLVSDQLHRYSQLVSERTS